MFPFNVNIFHLEPLQSSSNREFDKNMFLLHTWYNIQHMLRSRNCLSCYSKTILVIIVTRFTHWKMSLFSNIRSTIIWIVIFQLWAAHIKRWARSLQICITSDALFIRKPISINSSEACRITYYLIIRCTRERGIGEYVDANSFPVSKIVMLKLLKIYRITKLIGIIIIIMIIITLNYIYNFVFIRTPLTTMLPISKSMEFISQTLFWMLFGTTENLISIPYGLESAISKGSTLMHSLAKHFPHCRTLWYPQIQIQYFWNQIRSGDCFI